MYSTMYLNLDSNFNNKKIVNFLLDDITLMTKKLRKANKLARTYTNRKI